MSVIKNLNPHFTYQRGKVTTNTLWGNPTYSKIKDFFLEIKSTTDIMKDYDLYLVGGVLWDINKIKSIDIIMIGNPTSYIILEDYMHYMYDIALNKFNILIDISWNTSKPPKIINTSKYEVNINDEFLKIGYIKRQIGEDITEVDIRNHPQHSVQGDYLIKGSHRNEIKWLDKLNNRIKNSKTQNKVLSFSVKEFLESSEKYFLKNTNRP